MNRRISRELNNLSNVYSLNRLSNPDVEIASELTAGGDKDYLVGDIRDIDHFSIEDKRG